MIGIVGVPDEHRVTPARMYVCICNTLTSRQIHGVIGDGATSVDAVYRGCGVEPRCGKCRPAIHALLAGRAATDRQRALGEGWAIGAGASAA